jgi:hypothetical protein
MCNALRVHPIAGINTPPCHSAQSFEQINLKCALKMFKSTISQLISLLDILSADVHQTSRSNNRIVSVRHPRLPPQITSMPTLLLPRTPHPQPHTPDIQYAPIIQISIRHNVVPSLFAQLRGVSASTILAFTKSVKFSFASMGWQA